MSENMEQFYNDVMDNNTLEEVMGLMVGSVDLSALKYYNITESEYHATLEQVYANW